MGTNLPYVRHFSELQVYQKQRDLAKGVFRISKAFPREELYSLTDQIRRASRSIGAQIAEAWAKRPYPKHWISKLTDADAEQMETQHWLIEALDCDYMDQSEFEILTEQCAEIGRMLSSMISKASSFSAEDFLLRDDSIPYLIDDNETSAVTRSQ